jgi:sterol desaturase/sphingolipid hydroxylase (fatty acid hydroxylase superfamily)
MIKAILLICGGLSSFLVPFILLMVFRYRTGKPWKAIVLAFLLGTLFNFTIITLGTLIPPILLGGLILLSEVFIGVTLVVFGPYSAMFCGIVFLELWRGLYPEGFHRVMTAPRTDDSE